MNTDDLKSLLKRSGYTGDCTARHADQACPDDYELASYMDGGLSELDHGRFELHLADCAYCLERVGILGRAGESETTALVPELLQARSARLARDVDTGRFDRGLWHKAPRWAAAAVVVLAIGVLMQSYSPRQIGPDAPSAEQPSALSSDVRQTRNINPGAIAPGFLSSRDGMTMIPGEGVFRWTEVPDSLFYRLRIVSDEGDLVWQGRVDGTQWVLPSGLSLSSGAEYFVRVDAYLSEAKALNSDYLLFRVGEQR